MQQILITGATGSLAPFLIHTLLHEAQNYGVVLDPAVRANLEQEYSSILRCGREMRERGIRVLPGGDYGLFCNPQGTHARDLEHFVNLFGYSPMAAIQAATRRGGALMGMGGELGQLREGYLADLLLVAAL